jgi:RecJ-like exonuclease
MNFMIESHVLQKLKPDIQQCIQHIQKAVDAKQPIFIRHHADADGYTAGIAIERALFPLISLQHRRERDVHYFYQRFPSLTPYYSYEDATRDVQTFLRNSEQFEMKPPLILLLDIGAGSESAPALHLVKTYGASVVIIDHHPPHELAVHAADYSLNPHTVTHQYDFSAGMLCAEIAHFLTQDLKDLFCQNFYFIAAVSGVADKVSGEDIKKYVALCEKNNISKEKIVEVAVAVDYQAFVLGPAGGREIVHDILGKDESRQHKLLSIINKQLQHVFHTQLATCLKYAEQLQKKDFVFVKIPMDDVMSKQGYPQRGRTAGLVLQHFVNAKKVALVVGCGKSSFNFRCSTEIVGFDVQDFIAKSRKKFPHAQISGGGHRVAGSIYFVQGAYSEMMQFLEEYIDAL